jgi:hypothetical protein
MNRIRRSLRPGRDRHDQVGRLWVLLVLLLTLLAPGASAADVPAPTPAPMPPPPSSTIGDVDVMTEARDVPVLA